MAGRVHDLDLELSEIQLVAIDQVAVGGAQELLGVGRVDAGLAARDCFYVVLARDVSWVPVRGEDVLDGQAGGLLCDALRGQPGIDDHRLLRGRAGDDVRVHLTFQL